MTDDSPRDALRDLSGLRYHDVAKLIDHALLTPTLSRSDLQAGCRLAAAYDVASVCLLPYAVPLCAAALVGTTVKTSTVIGFPHGGQATQTKQAEAEVALADGCEELDMVVNLSLVATGDWAAVADDVRAVTELTHTAGQKIKLIFETCYLTESQKIELCRIGSDLGVDWVKTSTGFGPGGSTEADLILMRRHAAPHVGVKASGGLRSLDAVLTARSLGASRCGTSKTAEILDACRERLGLPPIETEKPRSTAGY